MALERTAKNLNVNLLQIPLENKEHNKWKSDLTGQYVSVENAILDLFKIKNWNGYAGEGGLILNLIKAMSFPVISNRHRSCFIEAIYAKNVAFKEDLFETDWLLNNIDQATENQVRKNFKIMSSKEPYTINFGSFTSTQDTSMLDFFSDLKENLFVELYNALGNKKIREIAEIFSENPYEYRKGWPDVTLWKNNNVYFLEVKAPGDRLQKSQKTIINKFMKPLNLNFALVNVSASLKSSNTIKTN